MAFDTQHRTVESRPIRAMADVVVLKPFSRLAFLAPKARADQRLAADGMTEFAALGR
jgi:hypothetical protein